MSNPTLYNFVKDTNKVFGDVSDVYAPLVDLEIDYMYRRIMIVSTLDQPIVLRFTNPNNGAPVQSELEIPINPISPSLGYEITMDEFLHNGEIEYKYVSAAPLEGALKMVSWRGENV